MYARQEEAQGKEVAVEKWQLAQLRPADVGTQRDIGVVLNGRPFVLGLHLDLRFGLRGWRRRRLGRFSSLCLLLLLRRRRWGWWRRRRRRGGRCDVDWRNGFVGLTYWQIEGIG